MCFVETFKFRTCPRCVADSDKLGQMFSILQLVINEILLALSDLRSAETMLIFIHKHYS